MIILPSTSHQVIFAAENVSELTVVQLVGRVVANDDGRRRRRHGLVVAALLAEGGVRRSVPAVEEEEAGGKETARAQVLLATSYVLPGASKSQT